MKENELPGTVLDCLTRQSDGKQYVSVDDLRLYLLKCCQSMRNSTLKPSETLELLEEQLSKLKKPTK